MNKILVFWVLTFLPEIGKCQIDSNLVEFNANMVVYSHFVQRSAVTKNEVINFLNSGEKFKIIYLQSSGFKNFVFIMLKDSIGSIQEKDTIIEKEKSYHLVHPINQEFILGFNTVNNMIFKIKGFKCNEFAELFYYNYYTYPDSYKRDFFYKKKYYLKYFSIEGINMKEYYNTFLKK